MSRFSDAPAEFTIAVVVVLLLLFAVWKFVKGVAKTVILLAIVIAVIVVLFRMGRLGM